MKDKSKYQKGILYRVLFDLKKDVFDLKKVVVELSKGTYKLVRTIFLIMIPITLGPRLESQAPQKPQIIMDNPTKDIHGQFNNDGFNEAEIIEESLSIADKEKELIIKALQNIMEDVKMQLKI